MSFLRVVEGFQQGAFVDGRAGVAYIRNMQPDSTDFLDEIWTMFIATTGLAVYSETALTSTFFSAKRGSLYSAGHPILACIVREPRLPGSDLNRILPNFPGDGGWILVQFGSYFLKGHSFL